MEYILIVIVCLMAYLKSFKYEPVVDDIANRRRELKNPVYYSRRSFLNRILLRLDGRCPHPNLYVDRAITIAIHTIVCVLIYTAFSNIAVSLLFAVNVSNNQVSLWLNGKRYGINAIICLLCFVFAPYCFPIWFITPFFQASALTFPVFLALFGYWWILLLSPIALLVGNKYIISRLNGRLKKINPELKTWNNKKIILMLKTIAFYFFRGIIPFAPIMYISYLKHFGLTDKDNAEGYKFDLSALTGLIIVILTALLYVTNRELSLGLVWWLVTISVYSNWKTATVLFGERYCYLPNIGLMLFLINILWFIHPQAWVFVFGLYTARLITFMPMYKNADKYFKHHTDIDPTHDCAWNTRISDAMTQGNLSKALRLTDQALDYCSTSPRILINKADLANASGNLQYALEFLNKARKYCVGEFSSILPSIGKIEQLMKYPNGGSK